MTMTDRRVPVDANSRIVVSGAAVGLGMALVGAMAWADRPTDNTTGAQGQGSDPTVEATNRLVVIAPELTIERARIPDSATATVSRQPDSRAPNTRSQGS